VYNGTLLSINFWVFMTADQYLLNILAREEVNTGINSPAVTVSNTLLSVLQQWGGVYLLSVEPSGSFAKGTANRSGTDVDLFLSLSHDVTNTMKEIYETLVNRMTQSGYSPNRQNVSVNVNVGGFSVDLVPSKRQNAYDNDHSLYRRRADTWTKTNVTKHINHVINSGRSQDIRVLKLWRKQKNLDFPSFYLELTVINALAGKYGTLSERVWIVFQYLRDTFPTARVVDPANTNNIISDDLTDAEKSKIRVAAVASLAATNWNQIVK
jgi:hypothetical protein